MNSIPIPPDDFLKEGFYVGDPHDLMDKDESIYFDSKTNELKTEIDKIESLFYNVDMITVIRIIQLLIINLQYFIMRLRKETPI